jgi:YidC/Oxa1 family membrane protein insertase
MLAVAIWDSVRQGLGWVLAFFYSIIPNSGVAIILLTVAVRLVLFPLTAKQAKSMIAMQRVQPEIKKLQAKYKNDRQKLNEEMMKFYKENQINPLGGCLPLLLQMPIFIALFQTLRDIPKFIPHPPARFSQMYVDICGKTTPSKCTPNMHFAGMNLTTSASKAASSGFSVVWPYLILVAIVVVTGFIQQRQTMRNQTQANPQMAIISKVFPVVFAFISWGLPSGVGLYFATSNLWQIGQQEVVYRTMGAGASPPPKKGQGEIEGSGGKGKGGGGGSTAVDDAPKSSGPKGGAAKGGTAKGGTARGGAAKGGPAKSGVGKSTGRAGSRPTGKADPPGDAKGGANGSKDGANGSKNGSGQSRPAGGARSNRKRKR